MSEWQPIEIWKPVVDAGGRYFVSSLGRVMASNGRILKQWASDQGYMLVRLSRPRVVARVHRLVAEAFVPNPDGKPSVNHIDCNRSSNAAVNLEWCTQEENLRYADSLGRMQRDYWTGRRSPNAALSDEQVVAIRNAYAEGGSSWASLASRFGISKRAVGRLINRETYSDVG